MQAVRDFIILMLLINLGVIARSIYRGHYGDLKIIVPTFLYLLICLASTM